MKKGRDGGKREKKKKEKTDDYSGHYVIASSWPLERRTLVPIPGSGTKKLPYNGNRKAALVLLNEWLNIVIQWRLLSVWKKDEVEWFFLTDYTSLCEPIFHELLMHVMLSLVHESDSFSGVNTHRFVSCCCCCLEAVFKKCLDMVGNCPRLFKTICSMIKYCDIYIKWSNIV